MYVLEKNLFNEINTAMIELCKMELELLKEIIGIGLSKAADSFSFFTKGKVTIKLNEIKLNFDSYFPLSRKYPTSKNYLLKTMIKGELNGEAYLLFSDEDTELILIKNLPNSINLLSEEKKEIEKNILLEIDNIITASVVTQFANILQSKIYGDVPAINFLEGFEINQFLSANYNRSYNALFFSARFVSESTELSPEFIWLMDNNFFTALKNIISDKSKMELLYKLNIN